ncbi:hypothetical protein GCM10020218_025650 [Dactylosporangium vinaceum]
MLHRTAKDGLGRPTSRDHPALDEGADVVIQMDADLSHPASAIPAMLDALRKHRRGSRPGSRYVEGGSVAGEWPWHRRRCRRGQLFYVNTILRLHVKDVTAGFKRGGPRPCAASTRSQIRSNGYSFQVEMNYRTVARGMRIVEVPIRFERAQRRHVQDEPQGPGRVGPDACACSSAAIRQVMPNPRKLYGPE